MLAAKVVVEDPAVGGFVSVWLAEVHPVAFDGLGHATDEDYRAIRFLPFHDPDVRQRIVYFAVSVIVPCIIKEDKIAGMGDRSLVERALLPDVCIDNLDAVGVRGDWFSVIKIDPVSEKHCTGYPCTIIGDAPAVAVNRCGAYELGCCLYDRIAAWRALDGSATGALCWY